MTKQSKKKQSKKKQSKATLVKSNVPDTSRAKKGSAMPMTKNYIDIEAGIKKDKEVKEKDVFDFNSKPKANFVKKNQKSVYK